jgi:hypothetical protein
MRPAFKEQWNNQRTEKFIRCLHGLAGSHCQVEIAYFRLTRGALIKERYSNWKPLCDRGNALVPNGVAREIDRLFWIVREENDETSYLSPAQPFLVHAVPGRKSLAGLVPVPSEDHLPARLQPQTIPTEPFGALPRRKHCFGIFQQRPAAAIEVVEMMIVAEEHMVECTHSLGTKRRAREFCEALPVPTGIRLQRGRMSGR